MTRLFDDLFRIVTNAATGLHDALECTAEQSIWDQCEFQEVSSTAAFAQVDLLMLGYAEEQDGQLSSEARRDALTNVDVLSGCLTAQASHLATLDHQTPDITTTSSSFNRDQIKRAATNLAQLSDSVKLEPPALPVKGSIDIQPLNTEVQKYLDILYRALTKQFSSNCGHQHVARLKLTGFTENVGCTIRFSFDLFLSSRFDWTPCRWLQSSCQVEKSLESSEAPGCRFIEDAEIQKRSLCIRLSEQSVGGLLCGYGFLMSHTPNPTISLGYLIDNGYFSKTFRVDDRQNRYFLPSERAALCCTLARSLLHFSRGDWTQVNWDIDRIYFLEDARTHRLLDKDQPYLSWTLANRLSGGNSETQTGTINNAASTPNPILIDFARLLLEVHGHQRIRCDQSREHLHALLFECNNQISGLQVRAAVAACLGSEGGDAARGRDPDRLRDFIFQKVLQQLEVNQQIHKKPQLDGSTTEALLTRPLTSSELTLPEQSPYDGKEYAVPADRFVANEALRFMKRMKKYTDDHIRRFENCTTPSIPSHLSNKIRIAVIDSGARRDDFLIEGAIQGRRIREGRNFLSGPANEWNDTHGHGTHIARLVLNMAPEAEIYVAKVTNGQHIEQEMIHCIAQAVNWAVQVWQVDIISLSLVVREKNEALESELKQAMNPTYEGSRRRIVFAAAGNDGGNAPMGWLASMPNIIAIHATDGLGVPANFNPTSLSGESFATLGQDIRSNWKESGTQNPPKPIYLSGTSFATPIAASIAANVLEWARWNIEMNQDQKKLLFSSGYMRKVFAKMKQTRSGCHYIQPWTLWDDGWNSGFGEKQRVKQVLTEVIAS